MTSSATCGYASAPTGCQACFRPCPAAAMPCCSQVAIATNHSAMHAESVHLFNPMLACICASLLIIIACTHGICITIQQGCLLIVHVAHLTVWLFHAVAHLDEARSAARWPSRCAANLDACNALCHCAVRLAFWCAVSWAGGDRIVRICRLCSRFVSAILLYARA